MDIKKSEKVSNHDSMGYSRQSAPAPSNKSKLALIIASIVALLVVALVAVLLTTKTTRPTNGDDAVMTDRFQAVFLTNGQVYFGKVSDLEKNYVNLKNIYYLQVQQSVQPSTDKPQQSNGADSQVSLTKLGQELHGPTDEMHIAREQILFWENLENDSTVVKAIKDYESKK